MQFQPPGFQGNQFLDRGAALGEGEQLPGQTLGLLAGIVRGSQALTALVSQGLECQHAQPDVAKNGGKDVVEVVGNATGQSPDGFHLLGLHQMGLQFGPLVFDPLALGDISDQGYTLYPLRGPDGSGIYLHRYGVAISPGIGKLQMLDDPGLLTLLLGVGIFRDPAAPSTR